MAHILIIDDDSDICGLLQKKMEGAGYNVSIACNGVEAIERHREVPADVVITDIFMPEKEGLELIREFRRDFPGVKIVAVSGGGPESLSGLPAMDIFDFAKKMGALHVFKKPLDMDALLKAVKELL